MYDWIEEDMFAVILCIRELTKQFWALTVLRLKEASIARQ
jgi:hypothetical protein